MYYIPESLFELISEPLQHRLNRRPFGACTGAMTQAWILCQNPQRLLFGHRENGWTDAFTLTRRFFRWSRFFCSGLPTAMWLSPLYIRAPPGSFKLPLTHWIPEATLEKKRECIEQKSDDLDLDSVQHLKNSTFASVASVLELGPTECRSSEGLGACYSWCLTAPRRSWWSEGSWWALGVCGSLKKRSLYTVWGSPFRRWRKSILSDHLLLGEVRERYPCVGAPTWIRGEHQLLDTTGKKSGCLVSFAFTSQQQQQHSLFSQASWGRPFAFTSNN